ncbi:MAG: peptidoglycan-binding domain-containing protein [Eubacteriales bacterium]|nr:peptidoglycan-binding domain-containing protein [Eubacteriales bacterium]
MYTVAQRRAHIYELQHALRRIQRQQGAPQPLAPDGLYGQETAAAVRDFQRAHGLPVTGTADYATWTAIDRAARALDTDSTLPQMLSFFPAGADAALSPGDRGASVFALQLILGTAAPHFGALPTVPLTGVYDADTVAGVRQAQGVLLLPATGVTDRATWDALALLHDSLFGRTPLPWLLHGAERPPFSAPDR